MIQVLNNVVLTADLPESGLTAGDIGTAVLVHGAREGFEVEFVALNGETIAVVSVAANVVRPVARFEIAHARKVPIPVAAWRKRPAP